MDNEAQTISRKWKLTLWMITLYTFVYGIAYTVVSYMIIKNIVTPEIWKEATLSYLAMWSWAVFAVSGWYLGINVIQKWSPIPGSGVK